MEPLWADSRSAHLWLIAAERVRLVEDPVAVARDVEVEPAVAVIVEECRRGRPGSALRPKSRAVRKVPSPLLRYSTLGP